YGISKDAKNPEIVIKWLDYIYASEEGSRLLQYGVEGLSYEMVNGEPEFTDFVKNNPDGLSPVQSLMSIGAFPTLPWIRSAEGPLSLQPWKLLELTPGQTEQAERVKPYMTEAFHIGKIMASPEE